MKPADYDKHLAIASQMPRLFGILEKEIKNLKIYYG
jgi:hypothetical protein